MSIWFRKYELEEVNARGEGTMLDFLDIHFTEIGDDFLRAVMPITPRVRQPIGLLHGGASVVLAESVASTAANLVVDSSKYYCVGLEINANHIKASREGDVVATARALHLGRSTQVWEIRIEREEQLVCMSRMTAAVVKRKDA